MMNPFKFGTVVDDPFFTDREEELKRITSFFDSQNHLTVISPRRFGKTSLVRRAVRLAKVRSIYLDLQVIVSPADMAAQLLRRVYALSAFEKLKGFVRNFRIIPALKLNPVTGEIDVTFSPGDDGHIVLEDVLNLIDTLGSPKKRIVVVFDEFQEIFRIGEGLDRMLRSVMQRHTNVNYLFLGSAESMIRSVFETKRSPFYHFAALMTLGPLPVKEFSKYLGQRFEGVAENPDLMAAAILSITGAHPYYTQQLAFYIWEKISASGHTINIVDDAISEILACHDYDYERLWNSLNRTDMKVMIGLAYGEGEPLSGSFISNTGTGSTSTVYSSLKRLTAQGILIRQGIDYLYDDPFFKRWILERRSS
jgi:uncharacterized protein